MAIILPFRGILPNPELADKIVTHSADNYTILEAKQIVEHNPLSYLSVIYPDCIDKRKTLPHSIERFQKIYQRFQYFKNNNFLSQDSKPIYYIYRQEHAQFAFNGIIAAISVQDYLQGNIKIHEQTLSEREVKLKEYLKHCKINAEPVLFFYEKNIHLQTILSDIQSYPPFIELILDNVTHKLWKSTNEVFNQQIKKLFDELPAVYIGDGHHRSASSVLLAKELGNTNKSTQYFLGAFFQEDELKIYSFHRLLKNISIPDNFIEKLKVHFEVTEINNSTYSLTKNCIGMYLNSQRYLLTFKQLSNLLDTEILYEYILKPMFHIIDIRNNSSIQYFSEYLYSKKQVEDMVKKGEYQLAFFTHPVSIETIKEVANLHKMMPPKSTYVLPKLLNALVIYSLENSM
ncbi:MAG: hypothetical protein KatS3mg027_0855 [Bacteroidia bacterium]|nr:MAG: hypothetical protein KatS3mg027_0855 [Bacteroidia bacterium]